MTTYRIEFSNAYVKPLLPGRDLWLAALRSGTYKQGTDALLLNGCYCCLGVLCDIQGRPRHGGPLQIGFDNDFDVINTDNPLYDHLTSTGDFPEGVSVSVRIEDNEEETVTNLAACNDSNLTFPQIADLIEAVWADAPHNWSTMRNPIPCQSS